jgi:hypothetical protein
MERTIEQRVARRHRLAKAYQEKIPGGLAKGKSPKDFDKNLLEEGAKVEMEHTTDQEFAREIAMDHLTEDENYYKKLKKIEDKE